MTSIFSSDDLTTDSLTAALRSAGELGDDTRVTSIDAKPFGGEESMMSSLQRVTVQYDRPTDAPTSLIAKFASDNAEMAFVASLFHFYEREVRYYNELDHRVTIATPRCFHAAMDPDGDGFAILLEEVTGHRTVDQLDGLGLDDATTCLRALADLHAPFWGSDLSAFAETMLPFDSPALVGLLPDKLSSDWEAARPRVLERLGPEGAAVCDQLTGALPGVLAAMVTSPTTMTHGDCRADNLLFDDDGNLVLLDYQLMAIGHGMTDVAYCISQSVASELAADHADELIQVYLDRLAEHGIGADRAEAMAAYQAGCLFYLAIPIALLANDDLHDRAYELGHVALQRATTEARRCGATTTYL